MRILLLLAALPMWGAGDANQILKRFAEAEKKNWEQALQYAYTEEMTTFSYDKKGQPVQNGSAVWDVIFVEGLAYKKLISKDGKPLDAKGQAQEEKKMLQTAEERRKARRAGIFHSTISTGSTEDLLTLFENRVIGEEEIRGRKAWVIESVPLPGHVPANQHEKEVLSFRHKLWIDEAEDISLKTVRTVVGEHVFMKPGSTLTDEFEKINDDAWLATRTSMDFRLQFAKFIKPSGRTDYKRSNFHKFNVQSTITVDVPK